MKNSQILECVKKALENSKPRNYKESVDLTINLKDIDLSNPKNRIEEEVILPKGSGKEVKVGLFGSGELALKARDSADIIIKPEDIEELAKDKKKAKLLAKEYQFFIAEAPLMVAIGKKLGVILGPRGKMPKPIPPTADPKPIIDNLRNSVRIRTKDKPTLHVPVGTKDMAPEDIASNISAILKRITGRLERGEKNINSIYVKTTMGKTVRIL